jgi:hypothetical protein
MVPEKPQSPFASKEISEPPQPAADQEHPDDRSVLVLVNTFGLAHLWRDLLSGGT